MITSYELWQQFIGKVNTHQGGHVRPHRNFVDWLNAISLALFEEEYAVWEKTQQITDRLMPFLNSVNVLVTSTPGQMWDLVTLPTGYEHFSSARIYKKKDLYCGDRSLNTIDGNSGKESRCNNYIDEDDKELLKRQQDANICEITIGKVKNNQWGAICEHKTKKPSHSNPICTQYKNGLKIAPKGIGIIVMDYFKLPTKCTFDYTITDPGTENEYIQYDINSIPLEWSQTMINEFLTRLQKNYGTFVREPILYEQGERDRNTTA